MFQLTSTWPGFSQQHCLAEGTCKFGFVASWITKNYSLLPLLPISWPSWPLFSCSEWVIYLFHLVWLKKTCLYSLWQTLSEKARLRWNSRSDEIKWGFGHCSSLPPSQLTRLFCSSCQWAGNHPWLDALLGSCPCHQAMCKSCGIFARISISASLPMSPSYSKTMTFAGQRQRFLYACLNLCMRMHAMVCHNDQYSYLKLRSSIILLAFIFHLLFKWRRDPWHVTQWKKWNHWCPGFLMQEWECHFLQLFKERWSDTILFRYEFTPNCHQDAWIVPVFGDFQTSGCSRIDHLRDEEVAEKTCVVIIISGGFSKVLMFDPTGLVRQNTFLKLTVAWSLQNKYFFPKKIRNLLFVISKGRLPSEMKKHRGKVWKCLRWFYSSVN